MRTIVIAALLLAACAHTDRPVLHALGWPELTNDSSEVRLWLDEGLVMPHHVLRIRQTPHRTFVELASWWPEAAGAGLAYAIRRDCPEIRTGAGFTACVRELPASAVAELMTEVEQLAEPRAVEPGLITVIADGRTLEVERCANGECRRMHFPVTGADATGYDARAMRVAQLMDGIIARYER